MADRKATNKYYPPEWDPSKGSINTFRGSHPLRERARKLDQGIMIIRFELPYNIWCGGCGSHVGMGVRYNAEKTTVGKYYSTPIFKFRMKCHLCDNHFEIQTDPKNMDYVVVSGASRKNEKWEHVEGETVAVEGKSEAEKLATDPMYRLEHGAEDKKKADDAAPRLAKIMEMQQKHYDDFELNSVLRKKFRGEKARLKEKAEKDQALQNKASLSIPLVDEHPDDIKNAQKITFNSDSSAADRRRRRLEVKSQSVFASAGPSPSSSLVPRSPTEGWEKDQLGTKKARTLLMQARSKSGWGGAFASPSPRHPTTSSSSGVDVGRTKQMRNSLGIKTTHK